MSLQAQISPASYYVDHVCSITRNNEMVEIHIHGGYINKAELDRIFGTLDGITGGKEYPFLVICEPSVKITLSALRLLGSKRAFNYTLATAFVISAYQHKLAAQLFKLMTINEVKPVKFFYNKLEAGNWLKNLLF